MPISIGSAIKQTRPFVSLEHEAVLAVHRLASDLAQGVVDLLRPTGLSPAQFNVLRILRGAGSAGTSCGEIGERLVTREPDVTRLLDRLEKEGFIERTRSPDDRRIVLTRISAKGLDVLSTLDEPMAELHRRQLGHLGENRLRQLIELLAIAEDPP